MLTLLSIPIIGMYYENLRFLPYLESVIGRIPQERRRIAHVIKMGRTQLEDAVPMTLGPNIQWFCKHIER